LAKENNNLKASNPIGIFDSGIGGLTVADAVTRMLPNEKIIYFGDTAHLPYGEKSADAIKYYGIRISQFLLEQKCKLIIIACNTASAQAYETIKDFVGNKAIVVNVIDPVVKEVSLNDKLRHVGVIATKGTIRSDIYSKKLKMARKDLEVSSLATPLLVSMIEEGFFNNKISRAVIHSYLERPKLKKIDSLILACTHFPLIKPEIEEYYQNKMIIVDSARVVAEEVVAILKENKLQTRLTKPKHHFYVSDYTDSFEKSTSFFFKGKIKLEKADIWK
jgi:glutamate racemase